MTIRCTRALDALGDPRALTALEPHLATCAECRAVTEAHARVRNALTRSLDTDAAVRMRDAGRAALTAVPPARPWWLGALAFITLTSGVAAAGAILMPRGNLASTARQISIAALLVAALFSGCWAAFSPRRRWSAVALAATFVAAVAVALGGSGLYPPWAGGFWEAGFRCARAVVLYALPSCAAALLLQRDLAFSVPRALAAGFAAGAAGALALHPHCPIGQAAHLTLFHVLPWFMVAAALLLLQRRLPRRSFAP